MSHRPSFLIEQGVTSDITGLFIRSNDDTRQMLLGAASLVLKYLPSSGSDTATIANGTLESPVRDFELDKELVDLMGEDEKNDWYISGFTWALRGMNKEFATKVTDELRGIHIGLLTPTTSDIQRLSNLSSGDYNDYLYILGINPDDIKGPVLDVGTGESAGFAKGLLQEKPDISITSTSMHIASEWSPMRQSLSGHDDVGRLVASDGTRLPFKDASFQTVISVNADPYYTPRRELADSLREKHRVLQIGGTAILCPAVCEFGNYQITENDICDIGIDVQITTMSEDAAMTRYRDGISTMLVIRK